MCLKKINLTQYISSENGEIRKKRKTTHIKRVKKNKIHLFSFFLSVFFCSSISAIYILLVILYFSVFRFLFFFILIIHKASFPILMHLFIHIYIYINWLIQLQKKQPYIDMDSWGRKDPIVIFTVFF
jgi:hypothetical protein